MSFTEQYFYEILVAIISLFTAGIVVTIKFFKKTTNRNKNTTNQNGNQVNAKGNVKFIGGDDNSNS